MFFEICKCCGELFDSDEDGEKFNKLFEFEADYYDDDFSDYCIACAIEKYNEDADDDDDDEDYTDYEEDEEEPVEGAGGEMIYLSDARFYEED